LFFFCCGRTGVTTREKPIFFFSFPGRGRDAADSVAQVNCCFSFFLLLYKVFGVVSLAEAQNVCFWKAEIKFLASPETSNIVSQFLFFTIYILET